MRAMNIKDRVASIIEHQRKVLQNEIQEYQQKLEDTMSFWGCGGPYRRQEAAIERREKQLEELDDFEMQLRRTQKHQDVRMYIFGCKSCGSITMVNRQPFDEWHECPVCRQMIHLNKLKDTQFQIVDTGEVWQQQIRKIAEEERTWQQ